MTRPSSDRDALSDRVNSSTKSRPSTTSTAKLYKTKTLTSLSSKTSAKMFLNYNNMFVDNIPANPVKSNYRINSIQHYSTFAADKGDSKRMFSEVSYYQTRLSGGANRTQQQVDKLILSPSQCKFQPAGFEYFEPKIQLNVIHLQLNDSHNNVNLDCHDLPLPRTGNSKTRATQTLYRESSAQTLPYLPGVLNDPEELETLEVFKLPTILSGDGPPGLYEVEVLERARKRWAFAKALKENFRKQLEEARDQAKLQKHHHVLEAFEWEHWLEREEYIQECQMLRLEILIRMFDKREREMYNSSQIRIQKSCEMIEAQRKAALKKNQIEYERALRRLEIKHAKQPRVWRKEDITKELGDPSSEFYAPKMRYGVNPNRRHFTASRKGFNMRMDDLEKTAVKMDYKHLKCPFAKLREWSKPKEVLQEVEQNFCSETNLKKLYESMRTLRQSSIKQKTTPLCLKAKKPQSTIEEEDNKYPEEDDVILKVKIKEEIATMQTPSNIKTKDSDSEDSENSQQRQQQEEFEHKQALEELRKQKETERLNIEMLQKEMRCEELETLISSYEGHTIGWLMRFLSEGMCRVKEQRKLHFLTMMAKRERWHREAAEAGLRQKENFLREEYGQLYEESNNANKEVAKKFISDIMNTDIKDYATDKAKDYITAMAKDLDVEISGWLESFSEVQTPLNYYTLRNALKDIVMPDKEKILYRLERDDCIDYIINDVLLANVYHLLEPYDVSFSLASDFVDRLIDNDIYLNSPDCSSECECTGFCSCSKARHEAMAILRKVIRRAVPGRRWCTPNERVAFENVKDILDDVFEKVIPTGSIIEVDMKKPLNVTDQGAHTDLVCSENDVIYNDNSENNSFKEDSMFRVRRLGSEPKFSVMDITKSLEHTEKLLLADTDKISEDRVLLHMDEYELPQRQYHPQKVHVIPSTYNISKVWDFAKTPTYNQTSSDDFVAEEETMEEEMYAKLQQIAGSEDMHEMKNEMETWALEMSSSHQGFDEDYEVEQTIDEIEEREKEQQHSKEIEITNEKEVLITDHKTISIPSSLLVTSKAHDKLTDPSVHFNEKTEQKFINRESEIEEVDDNDDDGFMKVSFTYDPTVKYSVPIPSNIEILETNTEYINDEEDDTEELH